MDEEKKMNSNVRGKLLRRWKSHPQMKGELFLGAGCECGGLKRYDISVCFRPNSQACLRRAKRKVIE